MMIFPLEWIDFLLLRHGGVTYEKGNTRVPHCELTEGVASPLPRPMQQLDQACSVRWLNWVKPQGFKAMHGLASGMMIMPRSTKASRQIHEAVVTMRRHRLSLPSSHINYIIHGAEWTLRHLPGQADPLNSYCSAQRPKRGIKQCKLSVAIFRSICIANAYKYSVESRDTQRPQ